MTPTLFPRWLLAPAALGALFVGLPIVAMALTVDWGSFGSLITSDASTDALLLSLRTALTSTLLCLVLGIPLPWFILGGAIYPLLVVMGLLYVRQAERHEREFTDIVERG